MITWTYLGEREGKTTKRVAVYRQDDGERVAWKSTPRTRGVVGHKYTAESFDGEHFPALELAGPADDIINIRLEDDRQREVWGHAAAVRKAKQRSELSGLDSAIEAAVKGLSYEAKAQLIRHVERKVWGS